MSELFIEVNEIKKKSRKVNSTILDSRKQQQPESNLENRKNATSIKNTVSEVKMIEAKKNSTFDNKNNKNFSLLKNITLSTKRFSSNLNYLNQDSSKIGMIIQRTNSLKKGMTIYFTKEIELITPENYNSLWKSKIDSCNLIYI